MKDTYLYFAGIDGGGGAADGTGQAYLGKAKNLVCVTPVTVTTTAIWFDSGKATAGQDNSAVDKIVITHTDTTTTTGHRCKLIAQACARAANAGPHVNIVDVMDVDNGLYFDGFASLTADTGFDMVVTLDT
jgi:hypothetical protein